MIDMHQTPIAISATKPIQVALPMHGFFNGQRIRFTKFTKFTGMQQLNNGLFVVQGCTTDTFQLYDVGGQPVDGSGYKYISGGQITLTGGICS
jgi:hypothetical protein